MKAKRTCFHLVLITLLSKFGTSQDSCGIGGTYYDNQTGDLCQVEDCVCDNGLQLTGPGYLPEVGRVNMPEEGDPNTILISGIFYFAGLPWGRELMNFTVHAINEGWRNILPPGTTLKYTLADSGCDESEAVRAYWKLREENGGTPMHGLLGAACSGATKSVARMTDLENVPQISHSSTSSQLSDKEHYPTFSRLVAPDDARGEVGAIISLLNFFGWNRVSVISTDRQFSMDFAAEFTNAWTASNGKIGYSNTVKLSLNGTIDQESLRMVLRGVPTNEPTVNSRIILLVAHYDLAYPILKIAEEMNFQPDTIWVGPSAWANRMREAVNSSWYPAYGCIGLNNYINNDVTYDDFLQKFRQWQILNGKRGPEVWDELPTFYAHYFVDSIISLSMALASVEPRQRRNGTLVTERIRQLKFDGISGPVEFTKDGDRKNPLFSIFNLQGNGQWVKIGITGITFGSASFLEGVSQVACFPEVGCVGLERIPSDSYLLPRAKIPAYAIVLIILPLLALAVLTVKYRRSRKSKLEIKAELAVFRNSIVGMRAADKDLVPFVAATNTENPIAILPHKIPVQSLVKAQWCWKEEPRCMVLHEPQEFWGVRDECWVKYDKDINAELEAAFEEQGGKGIFSQGSAYCVNFETMTQIHTATKCEQKVQRVLHGTKGEKKKNPILISNIQIGYALPEELQSEPQMILVKGDIVQISKQRSDGWAFGTKLHHTDEAMERELLTLAIKGVSEDVANVFTDTGWFRLNATRVPTHTDLAVLRNTVGEGAGALLDVPSYWDPVKDPTVVQLHELKRDHPEFLCVSENFLSTLNPGVIVIKIERIQHLAMWQTYVVKRQTICYRETGLQIDSGNAKNKEEIKEKALNRFEKKWLWHGSNLMVMDKILQQGFNRSFCGRNATIYGKGVYFARDASYAASISYAEPDQNGHQYVMACRVVVGEYCRGRRDALTPGIRDVKSQSLYDSTVDSKANPTVYVTYHDAQAYAEYLITFKQ